MVDPAGFWLQKVRELNKLKKYEDAQDCLRKIKEIENSKQNKDFWYKNGESFLELEMYEEAIECFNKDLTINDQSFESFYKKGISLYKLKKFKEAIECFNKAWQSNYSHYLKTKNHIDELKLRRQYELALLQSTELNQSKSIPVKFWYYKGLALSECAEYKEAVDCYDQALKLVSDDVSVLFEKARCELHLGEKESCLILLKKICSSDIKMLEKILKDKTFQLFNEE